MKQKPAPSQSQLSWCHVYFKAKEEHTHLMAEHQGTVRADGSVMGNNLGDEGDRRQDTGPQGLAVAGTAGCS